MPIDSIHIASVALPYDALMYTTLILGALSFVALCVFRYRHYCLLVKYASWQTEAEAVEEATHSALYSMQDSYPRITIVVPTRNQAGSLDEVLSRLLQQSYKGFYEVIVADQRSDDDTPVVIEKYMRAYKNLRTTRVPETSRNIELRKLAVTLGIKAAHGDWVIVVNPETVPATYTWLQYYSQCLRDDVDFVEGYYNYADNGTLMLRHAILERVYRFTAYLRGFQNGHILGCQSANWAVRKEWFIAQGGFADSLNLSFGEESIFANMHANAERTIFLCSPETRLSEAEPLSKDALKDERVFECETKRHLNKASKFYIWEDRIATCFHYLMILALLGYAVVRFVEDIQAGQYALNFVYADLACLLLWGAAITVPLVLLRRSLRAVGERKYGAYIYLYDLVHPWHSLATHVRRILQRSSFRRKYL